MIYRKFALSNGNNATWELTDPSFKSFGASPTGLGFDTEASYIRVGNDNLVTYSQYGMVMKTLEILFYADTLQEKYTMYNDFVKFLMVDPIYLLYTPPLLEGNTYRMKVHIDSLDKTQVDPDTGMLSCPITMTPLSFWEDNIAHIYSASSASDEEGKIYPLDRPYAYATPSTGRITLACNGTLPSPLKITINGESTDVQWTLTDSNGEEYGVAKFNGTYDSVYVNSDEAEEEIVLVSAGEDVDNPYNYQDLTVGQADKTQVTFLRLKPLETSTLSFNLPTSFEGYVDIEFRNRYLSV